MTKFQVILTIIVALVCLVVGVLAVLRPQGIQSYVLRVYERNSRLRKANPFLPWMESRSYVWSLRLLGALAILLSVGILSALFIALLDE